MTLKVYSEEEKEKNFISKPRIHYVMLLIFILATMGVIAVLVYLAIDKQTENDISHAGAKTTPSPLTTPRPLTTDVYTGLEAQLSKIQASVGESPIVKLATEYPGWHGIMSENIYVATPENAQEVASLIKAAKQHNLRVRCLGSTLSYADLWADTGNMMVNASSLRTRSDGPPIVLDDSDPDNIRVTAAAGLQQIELIDFMMENHIQIPAFGSTKEITLAGAISTATHPDDIRSGPLSDYVVGVELIDGEGEVRKYEERTSPKEMAMVRACVGLCGVIYQITFKVEPLQVVVVSNDWLPVKNILRNTTFLQESTGSGGVALFWAPLSSLTPEEWQTYEETNRLPGEYDPWNDMAWFRQSVPSDDYNISTICTTSSASSRRKRALRTHTMPTLTGEYKVTEEEFTRHNLRNKRQAPIDTRPLLDHWLRYNLTRGWFDWTAPVCRPNQVTAIDLSTQEKIWEVEFILPENNTFSVTKDIAEIVYALVRAKAAETPPKIPVVTMEIRWMAVSPDCMICPGNVDSADHVTTIGIVAVENKPGFPEFATEVYNVIRADFPTMRVHWAKYYEYLPNLPETLKENYGDKLQTFLDTKKAAGIDPNDMFETRYLSQIFS